MKDKPKSVNGLMRHLRENGIEIGGSKQKQQLINTGYYHGYKGYRFFQNARNRLPFISYDEIYSTIQYDTELKSILYSKIMFIETALKNITLFAILEEIESDNIYEMYDKIISSYNNSPEKLSETDRKKLQMSKLRLQGSIQSALTNAYNRDNPKISHFYNNSKYDTVPIWAIFEILTMGDLGNLLSCLTIQMREKISKQLGINLSSDTKRELIYRYTYSLKDLRNAIAHNDIVYDARFRKFDPSAAMKSCLKNELKFPYINFKTIGDYIILIVYFLKLLKVSKTEILSFIRIFEKETEKYQKAVNENVTKITIHPDLLQRMDHLKKII